MRRGLLVAVVVAAGVACGAWAGSSVVTRSLGGGTVAVTNAQANSVWSPVAVLMAFGTPATGTVSVARVSGGVAYELASHAAAGVTGLVWVADAAIPFAVGDVFVVRSPETNGTAQVVLKAE